MARASLAGHVEPGTQLLTEDGERTFRRVANYLPDRLWATRYAEQAMQVFPTPLPTSQAFDGSLRSRLGLFNAGFRSTPDDYVSWSAYDSALAVNQTDAELPTDIGAGAAFGINVRMVNDGWAWAYNPRAIELVFRPVEGGEDGRLRVDISVDTRTLLPGPGKERTLFLPMTNPVGLAAGEYELLLGLPDPTPRLRGRAADAVRLANAGTWEASTGLNRLNARVRVWP